ncbi:hypothetical protein BB558_005687 [Smittium angustum]|uniref:CTD kinase subunit gamma Ctk3 C-terminal domain-containing protein n=1 Tax=Smittium angustum TaxID=133377 RepID=A0A2U1IZR9_SMIAN|nr:hypothetical protein BB558_005687 [Smittium angustum]
MFGKFPGSNGHKVISGNKGYGKSSSWYSVFRHVVVGLVDSVIPRTTEGDANLGISKKIVSSWKKKNIFDKNTNDKLYKLFNGRIVGIGSGDVKKGEIMKKIEEDREIHKKIKESLWIRPKRLGKSSKDSEGEDEIDKADIEEFEDNWKRCTHPLDVLDWTQLRKEQLKSYYDRWMIN